MAPDKAGVFVDDIAAKGPNTRYNDEPIKENEGIRRFVWEFAHTLAELLARVKEAGATISGEKFVLATPELELVGNIVSLEGRRVSHGIMSKIFKWKRCANVSQVRGFLGTVGVARKWIKDFARIAKPLTILTRNMPDIEFQWTDAAQEAMETLKDAVANSSAIKPLNYQMAREIDVKERRDSDLGLVTIAVDSSVIGAGWIIYQIFEDDEHPIIFGSLTFNERESRYSQPKLELYGVFRALKAERHNLWGFHFRIKVDARSLIEMINRPDLPNAPMNRWISFIQLFDFEIIHVPATRHRGPDGLSRREKAEEDSDDSDEEMEAESENKYVKSAAAIHFVEKEILEDYDEETTRRLTRARLNRRGGEGIALQTKWAFPTVLASETEGNDVEAFEGKGMEKEEGTMHSHKREEYDTKEHWDQLIRYLRELKTPRDKKEKKRLITRAKSFYWGDDRLWKRNGTSPPLLVVVNKNERLRICKSGHDQAGHRGRDPTYKNLVDRVWFPNMYETIRWYCKTCEECQLRSSYRPKIPIRPTYVRTILRKFATDVVKMPASGGYHFIVDCRDDLSGWLEARMLNRSLSTSIAKFIFEDVMCRFGCIPQLTTDNGGEFHGALTILAEKYKVPVVTISPYNAQANGLIEVGHRWWVDAMWKALNGDTKKWSSVFHQAVWADRITTRKGTGFSPYYLLYGQLPLFPFDITDRTWHVLDWHKVNSTKQLLAIRIKQLSRRDEDLAEGSAKQKKKREKAAEAFWRKHERSVFAGNYEPGTIVLVYQSWLDDQYGSKGALRWYGPYIVVQRRPSGSYILSELDGTILKKPQAAARVKLFHYRERTDPLIRSVPPTEPDPSSDVDTDDDVVDQAKASTNAAIVEYEVNARKRKRWDGGPGETKEERGKREDREIIYWDEVMSRWIERKERGAEGQEKQYQDIWEERAEKEREDAEMWDYRWQTEKGCDELEDSDEGDSLRYSNNRHPTVPLYDSGPIPAGWWGFRN